MKLLYRKLHVEKMFVGMTLHHICANNAHARILILTAAIDHKIHALFQITPQSHALSNLCPNSNTKKGNYDNPAIFHTTMAIPLMG